MKSNLKWILLPFALIYGAVTSVRNFLFDVNILKNYQPSVFSITVGNLQVGGTGKTPHVEYLIKLFRGQKIVILSRGYGRTTKGYQKAHSHSTAAGLGDEPFQIYQKFKNAVDVVVSENRKAGIRNLMEDMQPTVLLLDDAYQHRYVQPALTLLLTTYDEPFTDDFMLPLGNMRETAGGAKRADGIIVTKSPVEIPESRQNELLKSIHAYAKADTPIFFSTFSYGTPVSYAETAFNVSNQVVLLCGIAKPAYFISYCDKNYKVRESFEFADHFDFDRKSLEKIILSHTSGQFLTTEKDVAKIRAFLTENELNRFFYLPVEVRFLEEEKFNNFVLRSFKSFRAKAKV